MESQEQPDDIRAKPAVTPAHMEAMIARMKPDDEVYAARVFLKYLLEKRGVDGVLAFHKRAVKALDKQDGLDLYYDFDAEETAMFHRTYLKLWSRREFLNTAGWGIPGAVSFSYGAMKILGRMAGAPPEEKQTPATNRFDEAANWIQRNAYPPAEVVIGAALMNEAHEKWVEIKLEQIADAMDLLSDQLKAHMKEQKREGRGGR